MRHFAPKSHRVLLALALLLPILGISFSEVQAQELDLLPEAPVVTQHTATINGEAVRYTAEAGTLPIRENGKVMAHMFYIYYHRTNAPDGVDRPLLYSFNGGPGSSSVWLHLGGLGPRRVVLNDDGTMPPPPFGLQDNEYSILGV